MKSRPTSHAESQPNAGQDLGSQIDKAFERILSREPSAQERSQFTNYGGTLDSICRVLLNSNEFLYVE